MIARLRQSKHSAFWFGFVLWLVLWTAYYVITDAVSSQPNLAGSIVRVLLAFAIGLASIILLLIARLRWAALGYVAALILNGVGLFYIHEYHVSTIYLLPVAASIPFFLPSTVLP